MIWLIVPNYSTHTISLFIAEPLMGLLTSLNRPLTSISVDLLFSPPTKRVEFAASLLLVLADGSDISTVRPKLAEAPGIL